MNEKSFGRKLLENTIISVVAGAATIAGFYAVPAAVNLTNKVKAKFTHKSPEPTEE